MVDSNNIYKQIKIGNYILRYFPNKDKRKLFWHRDEKNREIRVLFGSVKLQLDNELPSFLKKFYKYNISKNVYHRVISDNPFLILIKEK